MRLSRSTIAIVFPLLLLVGVVVAYSPAIRGGFLWDDDAYVSENPVYDAPHPLQQIWGNFYSGPQWYPVVFTTFYLERQIWGNEPAGFHIVNVLAHAASAYLLWRILTRLKVPGAMLAAGVFALHPMMVESVAWISEAKNTLSTLFGLGAVLAFLEFALPPLPPEVEPANPSEPAEGAAESTAGQPAEAPAIPVIQAPAAEESLAVPQGNPWAFYAMSLGLFVLALLSKTVVSTLAPVLVLILWWKQPAGWKRLVLLTLPYFVLGLVGGLITAHIEVQHVGASGQAWHLTAIQKFLLAGQATWFYVGKLLFPARLSFFYDRWPIDAGAWWQWLAPVAAIGVLLALVLQLKCWGKGPLVAGLAFLAMLFPAMGFFPLFPMIFSWVADHFAYLAAVAFISGLCAMLTVFARRYIVQPELRVALGATLVVLLGARTLVTAFNYQSFESLWMSVISYNPDSPHWNALSGMSRVRQQQANAALKGGNIEEASRLMEEAKTFDEDSLKVRPEYPIAYSNLANYYLFKGQPKEALPYAIKAVQAAKVQGSSVDIRILVTVADIYAQMHDYAHAIPMYGEILNMDPTKADYFLKAARALMEAGRNDDAGPVIARALELRPGDGEAQLLQAFLLARQGKLVEALDGFRQAIQADPNNLDARDGFARLVAASRTIDQGDLQDALGMAEANVKQTSGQNLAYVDTWARMFVRVGRKEDAIKLLQSALANVPNADPASREVVQRDLEAWGATATSSAPTSMPATTQSR